MYYIYLQISKSIVTVLLFCHALVAYNMFFIVRDYKRFTLKTTLAQARLHFLIKEFSSFIVIEDRTLINYVIAITYLVTCVIKNVVNCYCALFYLISLYGLARISRNFRDSCRQNKEIKQLLMEYRSICRLTRNHDKYNGWGLLCFMLSGLFCSTFFVALGDFVSNSSNYGATIVKLWYTFVYITVVVLGILFTSMVVSVTYIYV